jgi:hypothetical protein
MKALAVSIHERPFDRASMMATIDPKPAPAIAQTSTGNGAPTIIAHIPAHMVAAKTGTVPSVVRMGMGFHLLSPMIVGNAEMFCMVYFWDGCHSALFSPQV